MWTIQRNTKSDEKSDSILEMENRFRSGGIGKSKMIYGHLYQIDGFQSIIIVASSGQCIIASKI
jgi:hypothetical protein